MVTWCDDMDVMGGVYCEDNLAEVPFRIPNDRSVVPNMQREKSRDCIKMMMVLSDGKIE